MTFVLNKRDLEELFMIEEASYTETAMMNGGVAGLFKFDNGG